MTQLMLITGPSGSGKTTLSEDLVRALPEVMKFVTDTTRDVRPGERHGEDYYFNRPEDFQKRINWNDFFEYQEVFKDKFYGFSRRELERFKRYEKTPIAAADVEGTLKFMRKIDRGFIDLTEIKPISFYIFAPHQQLIQRIYEDNEKGVRNDTEEEIKKRIARIPYELEQAKYFYHPFLVDNSDGHLDDTKEHMYKMLKKIINRELGVPMYY